MKKYSRKAFRKLMESFLVQMNHPYVASIRSEEFRDDVPATQRLDALFNVDGDLVFALFSDYDVIRIKPFVLMEDPVCQNQSFSFYVPGIKQWLETDGRYRWVMEKDSQGVPYLRQLKEGEKWPWKDRSEPIAPQVEMAFTRSADSEEGEEFPMDEGSPDPAVIQPPVYKVSIYDLTENEKQANIRPMRKAQTEHLFRMLGPNGPFGDKDIVDELTLLLQDIQRHVMGVFDIVVDVPGYLTAELVNQAIKASGLETKVLRVNGNTFVDHSLVAKVSLDTPRLEGFSQFNHGSPIIGIGLSILKAVEDSQLREPGRELVSALSTISQELVKRYPHGFTLATPFRPAVNKELRNYILKLVLNNEELFNVVTWEEAAA